MSDETTLLPCPFCGGEASKRLFYGTRYGVYCDECDARVGGLFNTEAEAIAAWNTRTHGTLTAEQVRAATYAHSIHADCADADWQAIADELNDLLGSGTCAQCAKDMGAYADSLCDPLKERIYELLRCLENDWHIRASWDGLRKFWNIELTEDGVKLRDAAHGTLTAEQVRELIAPHLDARPTFDFGRHGAVWRADFQAIADELNATLGGGECVPHGEWERVSQTQEVRHVFCKCGYELGMDERDSFPFKLTRLFAMPNYCQECGRKIRKAVES